MSTLSEKDNLDPSDPMYYAPRRMREEANTKLPAPTDTMRSVSSSPSDGHYTSGIEKHIEYLKAMFVYSPDTSIKVHPVKFGSGEWTSVIGVMTGTFTKPMPIGDGKFIQPTGKKFSLNMCTVGHWKDGVMIEEWLFWDSATYMKQMGIGQ